MSCAYLSKDDFHTLPFHCYREPLPSCSSPGLMKRHTQCSPLLWPQGRSPLTMQTSSLLQKDRANIRGNFQSVFTLEFAAYSDRGSDGDSSSSSRQRAGVLTRSFDQWLARLTKTCLQLQHGKLLNNHPWWIITSFLREVCSVATVLFLQALRVFCLCDRECKREREEEKA